MKKRILKILSVFSLFLLTIILANVNTFAATSTYDIATNFIFTTDINVEEGFELIKPYILIKDGFPSSESFTFDVIPTNAENEYTFKGKYPNGETFTAFTYIKKIESKCGSYIEAENIDVHYQALVAKKLNEDKTLNDCLDEAWRSFWTNIRFPEYKAPVNGTDTYLESSYKAGNTKEFVLRYVAKMASNSGNNGSSNSGGTNAGGSNSGSNSGSNNQGGNAEGDGGGNNSSNNSKADPVMIVLISLGGVLGLVLLFYLYELIRMIIKWLKR